jgi:pimeloyl-ACP methyl ester carboxylesterase
VVVGHGWGGYVAWAAAAIHPREVAALCAVAAPHPAPMLGSLRSARAGPALRHVLAMQVPMWPERRLARPATGFLGAHLRAWSAPGSGFPDEAAVATYQRAISLWPASHCALEYHRWLFRSRIRADGRRFTALMRPALRQPVCVVAGALDPAVPVSAVSRSRGRVAGAVTEQVMPGVGHFPHEETPAAFTELLLGWLAAVAPA